MTKTLMICTAVLLLAGCNTSVQPSTAERANIADRLSYLKDRHGICYAVVSSATYGFSEVASIATVPCAQVNL
jgi:uncharacterized lipoprotein YajG